MVLESGSCLGHFEILEPLGVGGMGEVYRARDTKLGRDVAIKVLTEAFSRDKERLARFEREARLLAQLNHANIATLHGLEESGGQPFLVMELAGPGRLWGRFLVHLKGGLHQDQPKTRLSSPPAGKVRPLQGVGSALRIFSPHL